MTFLDPLLGKQALPAPHLHRSTMQLALGQYSGLRGKPHLAVSAQQVGRQAPSRPDTTPQQPGI